MDSKILQLNKKTLRDSSEVQRIHMRAGIFKHAVKEYADKIVKRNKPIKNLSR